MPGGELLACSRERKRTYSSEMEAQRRSSASQRRTLHSHSRAPSMMMLVARRRHVRECALPVQLATGASGARQQGGPVSAACRQGEQHAARRRRMGRAQTDGGAGAGRRLLCRLGLVGGGKGLARARCDSRVGLQHGAEALLRRGGAATGARAAVHADEGRAAVRRARGRRRLPRGARKPPPARSRGGDGRGDGDSRPGLLELLRDGVRRRLPRRAAVVPARALRGAPPRALLPCRPQAVPHRQALHRRAGARRDR
mmetsp:Transcript_12560/g.40869  ORF Transcript_12560/g.40869 Transcript_12560/m.40869 type:complete len:256 (-) Transcript_12560:382-1149(-)